MSEKICGIYKITNLVNGKVYIGQSQDIYSRWKEHKYARNKRECFALYGAFKKYGLDNFSFEIVECCPFEQLNEKEIYYIAQYHSYVGDTKSNGYNMTKGGALSFTHVGNDDQGKVVYQYDLKGNFVAQYRNQHKAVKAVGLKGIASITRAIKEEGTAGGFQWRETYFDKIPPFQKKYKKKAVYQYSKFGEFIKEYENTDKAAEEVGCSKSLIEQCCEGHGKTGKGYQWSYERKENIGAVRSIEQPSKWKPVLLCDDEGNFMREFPCAKIASQELNISYGAVQHCLAVSCKTAYGYILKYK